ncbi:hypothetical protein [Paenibacillus oleatilyticus]|uniref:hypothetical protein n=1 Tax=Paenibacillus oleatilyticus TaxID=2594886 RepID=UPI001C1F7B2D|nr:hypothetical protein [Paenibacillus oleatilyticus]MBU7316103.1 hypothetical protein [Paenibacillus oleatilyticus]
MRIEKVITVIRDREPSDIKPNVAHRFDFEDEDGNEYEWNTTTDPEEVRRGQKWLVRMTVFQNASVLNRSFQRVKNVSFVERR